MHKYYVILTGNYALQAQELFFIQSIIDSIIDPTKVCDRMEKIQVKEIHKFSMCLKLTQLLA